MNTHFWDRLRNKIYKGKSKSDRLLEIASFFGMKPTKPIDEINVEGLMAMYNHARSIGSVDMVPVFLGDNGFIFFDPYKAEKFYIDQINGIQFYIDKEKQYESCLEEARKEQLILQLAEIKPEEE